MKEFALKSDKVFPSVEAPTQFKKSRLSKMITKEYLGDIEDLQEVKRTHSIMNPKRKEDPIISPVERRSGSILNFLEKRKSSDYEAFYK